MSTTHEKIYTVAKNGSAKRNIQEKVVQIYSAFFRNEDPSIGNPNFWDEFFLLKVNAASIQQHIGKMGGSQLVKLMPIFNMLFRRSVDTLQLDHPIRMHNALLTLCSLSRGILTRGSSGFDMINILIGFDAAERVMKALIDRLNTILTSPLDHHPPPIKSTVLSFLLLLVTSRDNVSENTLLEFLMVNSLFEALVKVISDTSLHSTIGNQSIHLIALIVQYRKNESINPYIVKLSILDDELALTGLANIISSNLFKANQQYRLKISEVETTGIFASLSNMVGSMFIGEEAKTETFKANDCVLLSLYEALHLNRNFNTTLSHSQTELPNSPHIESYTDAPALPTNHITEPTNLLVSFLEYFSAISQDVKDPCKYNSTKLCLIILTCMVEDQFANSLMHDTNLNFKVTLHRITMRHRKQPSNHNNSSRPLISSLIDLMIEFMMSHLMKNFPMELHMRCLGIVHRVICYEKKCRIRMVYDWAGLWNALINILKYVINNETTLIKQHNIFAICSRTMNLLNLFITYGDAFLSNPCCYDQLYYEVIRNHAVFENLYSISLRYASYTDHTYKEAATKLSGSLVNVRAIIDHFTPKLEAWSVAHQVASLTNDEVLEVVKVNYDSLTLKMQDFLDQYDRYSEKPKDLSAFMNVLVREIVRDVRRATELDLFKS